MVGGNHQLVETRRGCGSPLNSSVVLNMTEINSVKAASPATVCLDAVKCSACCALLYSRDDEPPRIASSVRGSKLMDTEWYVSSLYFSKTALRLCFFARRWHLARCNTVGSSCFSVTPV